MTGRAQYAMNGQIIRRDFHSLLCYDKVMKTVNPKFLMIAAALYAVSSGWFISARYFNDSKIAWILASAALYTVVLYWIHQADEIRKK